MNRDAQEPTMRVQLVAKNERSMTGFSRYAQDLYQCLHASPMEVQFTVPYGPHISEHLHHQLRGVGLNIPAFFATYPLCVRILPADVYHLSGQTLATLLSFQHFPGPVVVSVLDIIPHLVRKQQELCTFRHPFDRFFYRLALQNLWRADVLIAISDYTKRTLVESLKFPSERITVIHPTVDLNTFRPLPIPVSFLDKYALDRNSNYVLFVGSEDPRKNVTTLIQAFALIKRCSLNVKLLKVGEAQFPLERRKLLNLIQELGVTHDVRFFDYVPEQDLPLFYNLADVFVMPSLYEGFGLPLLEAMACGTAVVYADTGSLPEIAQGYGTGVHPSDAGAFATCIIELLENPNYRKQLGANGQKRASHFNRRRVASELQQVYVNQIEHKKYVNALSHRS